MVSVLTVERTLTEIAIIVWHQMHYFTNVKDTNKGKEGRGFCKMTRIRPKC